MLLLGLSPLTAAIATLTQGPVFEVLPQEGGAPNLTLLGDFEYGAGGTSLDVYLATSFDGALWFDIAQMHWTTSTAKKVYNLNGATSITNEYAPSAVGNLTADTCKDGFIGQYLSAWYKSSGIYTTNTAAKIWASGSRLRAV